MGGVAVGDVGMSDVETRLEISVCGTHYLCARAYPSMVLADEMPSHAPLV